MTARALESRDFIAADHQTGHERVKITGEVLRRGRTLRLIVNACIAAMTSFWIGPWAIVWLAATTLINQWVEPIFMARVIAQQTDPRRAGSIRIGVRIAGAVVHSSSWIAAWTVGGDEAGFLAGVLLMGTVVHALVYFSNSITTMVTTIAPPVALSVVLMAITHPQEIMGWLVLPVLILAVLRAYWAYIDQAKLFDAISRNRAMRRAAEEANVAKSQFLAMMSHELRTPLNAVIGYAEILEEDLSAEGKKNAAGDAARIRRAARDLLGLINEVLDLSKIEAGRMTVSAARANIKELVSDVIHTTSHIATANGTEVRLDIDPRLTELVIDAPKVRQCLLNLVSNACKFTQNGRIDIHVAVEEAAGDALLRASVTDTGCGISPDQAGRLFQPFVQADSSNTRSHGGTGLGLVITRRLAQLMGGDVEMQSALGEGSCFVLTVRASLPEAGEVLPMAADAPLVLVIEDESDARDLVRRALARMPLNVVCAATAGEGSRMATQLTPALIVLDIHLPDGSGWELLAEFKADAALSGVQVLVVSIDDDRSRALSLGACEHLVKPVDRDRLAAAVLRFVRMPEDPEANIKTFAKVA